MPRKPPVSLDVARFMRRHWQREPLLVRAAFPRFVDPLSPMQVLALARSADAVSRLVERRGRGWNVEHGPFSAARLRRLGKRDWTVLVQDTNHFSRAADRLLARFDFIPHARIDDVMVSYAAPGGGVGPHVDSYDVFLLQGRGRRRWRISRQKDLGFVAGLDLKILARFEPEREWTLEAGDMLYLPPGVAHDGVAETECLTWSVGFRAPADRELVAGFLDFLHERLDPRGQYRDPGSAPARHPGEVPSRLEAHIARAIARIRWSAPDVREFAGRFLSEPKAHVHFTAPARPLPLASFARRAAGTGLELDARARLLFSGTMFFLDGERVEVAPSARALVRELADRRALGAPIRAGRAFWETAHAWYRQGVLACAGEKG
ncbi:MAG TPA: cupin domain-containing protein [Usitatibacter sp.]|nr:cupin domain-containing protein [Usitatibacter sp.]